jgi:hypothetical protein
MSHAASAMVSSVGSATASGLGRTNAFWLSRLRFPSPVARATAGSATAPAVVTAARAAVRARNARRSTVRSAGSTLISASTVC